MHTLKTVFKQADVVTWSVLVAWSSRKSQPLDKKESSTNPNTTHNLVLFMWYFWSSYASYYYKSADTDHQFPLTPMSHLWAQV